MLFNVFVISLFTFVSLTLFTNMILLREVSGLLFVAWALIIPFLFIGVFNIFKALRKGKHYVKKYR